MTRSLRVAALLIALAGVIDPAIALRQRAPLPIQVLLPPAHDPSFQDAARIRESLLARLQGSVDVGGAENPHAIVAIGNVAAPASTSVPLLVIRDSSSPRLSAVALPPSSSVEGQKQTISPRFHARALAGRSTEFVLRRGEAAIASVSHRWSGDDEVFEPRFEFVSPAAGVDRLRVTASTEGLAPVVLDAPAMISRRRLRILVYEPRPSWAAAFVRQALERDPVFEVQARTNTSSGIGTVTAHVKGQGLAETDAFDALAIGGLESLTPADLERVNHFVSVRGGTVVLLPDARIPDNVRVGLDLPVFDEVLVERPVDVHSKTATLRASEFLFPKAGSGSHRELATVRHLGTERAAVIAMARGSGQLLISGLLDGWRFRADNGGGFEQFWRGVIADGALQSPPPLAIEIAPAVAAPGQPIRIRATLRETEWSRSGRDIALPMLSASLIPADGRAEMIRLWPAATPGVYTALLKVPSSGRYSVRVESASAAAEMPLLVEDAAASATPDHSPSLAALARSSGGGEFDTGLDAVVYRLQQMDPPLVENRVHPMRSGWWILPFAGLLTAEWTIRRRKGQR